MHSEVPNIQQGGESVVQKNEGKWDFTLQDSDDESLLVLDVSLGMQLVTTEVLVDVHPHVVRMLAKVNMRYKLSKQPASNRFPCLMLRSSWSCRGSCCSYILRKKSDQTKVLHNGQR